MAEVRQSDVEPMRRLLLGIVFLSTFSACGKDRSGAARPSVEIVEPEEGALINVDRLRVRGTAANVDRVEIDGVVAEVVGDEWEALVPVAQGEVTLTATGDGATDTVTFTVDSRPPALTVTGPERALYKLSSQGDTVLVTGTVSDEGTGLEVLKVGEQIIRPATSGAWQYEFPLKPGLNEIAVTARDVAGNTVDDIRGVMYGDFTSPTQTIDPAFNIWIDQQSLPVMEEVIEGFVTPNNVAVLMSRYFMNEYVQISSTTFDPIDFNVGLRQDVIDLEFVITNLVIQGMFTIGGDPMPATVEIRRMRVALEADPVVLGGGDLNVNFSNAVLELDPADLSYDLAGLTDEDSAFLEEQIIDIARTGFGYALSQGIFDSLYDPNILKRKIQLFGREIVFNLEIVAMDVFADGLLVKTTMEMPADRFAGVRDDAPGALNRLPGPGTGVETSEDIQFTVTRNALDRIMHGIWYSGLLHYELAGSDFEGKMLPFELTAGSLGTVIDGQISSLAGASTPAGLRLRPMFPPVAEYDVENKRLLVRIGEFMMDLVLMPQGQEPIVVATLSAFLDLSVRLAIEGVAVKLSFETELRADVAEEPHVDLDDEKAEGLLQDLIALIPAMVAQELLLYGESDINWVNLSAPIVDVHGANLDYATISLAMEANPQVLTPAEPDDGM